MLIFNVYHLMIYLILNQKMMLFPLFKIAVLKIITVDHYHLNSCILLCCRRNLQGCSCLHDINHKHLDLRELFSLAKFDLHRRFLRNLSAFLGKPWKLRTSLHLLHRDAYIWKSLCFCKLLMAQISCCFRGLEWIAICCSIRSGRLVRGLSLIFN
jgi:hypothetical protein